MTPYPYRSEFTEALHAFPVTYLSQSPAVLNEATKLLADIAGVVSRSWPTDCLPLLLDSKQEPSRKTTTEHLPSRKRRHSKNKQSTTTGHSHTDKARVNDSSSKTMLSARKHKNVRFTPGTKISDYFSCQTKNAVRDVLAAVDPPRSFYRLQGGPDLLHKASVHNVESCFAG